ncbi:deoxycytidylate deaminase isoform X2 [Myotis myotis]|nr:deoxycytidylate deaminase isoform X2 [Myotis myotis]XP_036156176.1 deoxycytidylate deaminase isoform X2 [Myotis myotis]XP_036156177.1 deoxycytidylate deaminase isoform X2 [Myotis myotis]
MSEVPCKKREDYLEWPEYFMAVAFLSAQRSKDPNSQVGACIVNAENKIVGIGYNGMPNGCSDDLLPWRRTAERKLDTKYPYDQWKKYPWVRIGKKDSIWPPHRAVCHAELNAIMNKNSADVKGCTIYVALFPCNECAKLIIQVSKKLYSCLISTTIARSPPPPGSCLIWLGSPSGNSHPSAARLSLTLIPSTAGPARSFSESRPIKPREVGITLPQGAGARFICKLHAPSRRRAAHGDAQLLRTKPHLPDSPVARSLHLTKLLI